jgi:hypothetical protein
VPWRGPAEPGEFPSLGYAVAEFIEAHCVVPDGELQGQPYLLTDEMFRNLVHVYRIDPETGRFVHDRGDQLVRPQKWGKGPLTAARICAEGHVEGPVLFDGWDADGEPVGRGWATPLIQVTAYSEDQADNVWKALLGMVRLGPLIEQWPDTGDTRIYTPEGADIEPVTSSAQSRLGQRLTFAAQDETHSWTRLNGGRKLADTQRRNVAGMGGRFHSTTNAWDPAEESVAQETVDEPGVYVDDVEPGSGSIRNRRERRRMMRRVYGDSAGKHGWVDLDRVESEIEALLGRDPAQAERFFLNRKRASEDAAFIPERIDAIAEPWAPEPGALVTLGIDGARSEDALAIVGTEVESGRQWSVGIWEQPAGAPETYEHPEHEIDGAVTEAFERLEVWRVYVDPQWIKHLLVRWQGQFGEKRVIAWYTNRPRQIAWAVRNYAAAMGGEQPELAHDGDETFVRHLKNAKKQTLNVRDDKGRLMHTLSKDRHDSPHKIDAAMAAVLSWEARGDAIAAGATTPGPSRVAVSV